MKYITVQPDNKYFEWQLKVLHQNMKEVDLFNDSITVIGFNRTPAAWAIDLKNQYPDKVFLIQDTRSDKTYQPSIRPHLLKKLLVQIPNFFDNQDWMYHDCDILFTKKFNWASLVKDDSKTYLSNTISYIGSEYIRSKGEGLLDEMCKVVGISPVLVDLNELNSGGAQYIFGKDVVVDWDKIERDSLSLFHLAIQSRQKYMPEYPLQAWTADMWAILWNLWNTGYKTEVIPAMDFSWATDEIEEYSKSNIYHNAGVTGTTGLHKNLFYKAAFINKSPFGTNLNYVDKRKCSFKYAQAIDRAHKNNLKANYRMN